MHPAAPSVRRRNSATDHLDGKRRGRVQRGVRVGPFDSRLILSLRTTSDKNEMLEKHKEDHALWSWLSWLSWLRRRRNLMQERLSDGSRRLRGSLRTAPERAPVG